MKRRALLTGSLVMSMGVAVPVWARNGNRNPVAETAQGKVRGQVNALGIHVFKGMRYAGSSANALRFMPPVAPPNWAGIQDAFEYGHQSPQTENFLTTAEPMSEDCLRINVWTPGLDNKKRPVMLWFHGGGFESGSGSSAVYEGSAMAHRGDVVVATINHRLNVFGHCYLGGVLGSDFQQSGNVGYLDLIAAMKWVRENISAFGGDPDNVMIYGQSGGGRKVSLCYAGADAQGLFHKGVVQSGSHLKVQTEEQANRLTEMLLKELSLTRATAYKLQQVDVETLSRAQHKVVSGAGMRFSPMLDNISFEAHPWLPDAPRISSHLPMMLGTTRTELSGQMDSIPGLFDLDEAQAKERLKEFVDPADVSEAYDVFKASRPQASPSEIFFTVASARVYVQDQTIMAEQRVAGRGAGKTYVYRLMWRSPVEEGRRVTPHSLDLPFMFDNVAVVPHMTGPETEETKAMVENMANSWLAFARTGDPNNSSIPQWKPYDLERRNTMMFDVPSRAVDDPHKAEREFMTRYRDPFMARDTGQQDGATALHRRAV